MPTSTRSFTQLLSAEAGVSTDLSPVLTNGNGNQSPSVNGTRTTSTSLFFNGVDATNITTNEGSLNDNIAPAPETLQEVKLQTSLYDASTGRSGGGNFQLVTKQGANRFNGNVYYYLQNEKLNANDYFFNKEGIDRPKARNALSPELIDTVSLVGRKEKVRDKMQVFREAGIDTLGVTPLAFDKPGRAWPWFGGFVAAILLSVALSEVVRPDAADLPDPARRGSYTELEPVFALPNLVLGADAEVELGQPEHVEVVQEPRPGV